MNRKTVLSFLAACLLCVPVSRGDEIAERLVRATYKIANEGSTATSLLLHMDLSEAETGVDEPDTRHFLLTANHVLSQMRGNSCVLTGRAKQADGGYQRREQMVAIRDRGRQLWIKHARHDLALLPLSEATNLESLPWESLADQEVWKGVFTGDDVRVAVFPERTESNPLGFPVLRQGSVASFPLSPASDHPIFLVHTTTWTGDSGGPVMHATKPAANAQPLVLGFVLGMRGITDTNKESRFVERRTSYPLDLGEVVQSVFARELVQQWLAED